MSDIERQVQSANQVESLNSLDLDVELLERRLEMSMIHPNGYLCGVDGKGCVGDTGGGCQDNHSGCTCDQSECPT